MTDETSFIDGLADLLGGELPLLAIWSDNASSLVVVMNQIQEMYDSGTDFHLRYLKGRWVYDAPTSIPYPGRTFPSRADQQATMLCIS